MITPVRLAGPANVSASATTIYTVPADIRTTLAYFEVSNPTGGALTFTLSIGSDSAANRIYNTTVKANERLTVRCMYVLLDGEVIQVSGGTSLVVVVNGYERPLGVVSYSTSFPLTENPILEGGRWRNGGAVGLDWSNMRTNGTLAFGTQVNGTPVPPYNDSGAILNGFPADYIIQATCHVEAGNIGAGFHELELLSRWVYSPNVARGYEFSHAYNGAYATFVRWNGPVSDFDPANSGGTPHGSLVTGAVMKVIVSGNILSGYVDYNGGSGFQLVQQVDITTDFPAGPVWNDGNPGMGHWNNGTTSTTTALAFSSFTATST